MPYATSLGQRWDARSGNTVYPIRARVVVRLAGQRNVKFRKPKITVACETFIWIITVRKVLKGVQPKDRLVRVVYLHRPLSNEFRHLYKLEQRVVQQDTLVRNMGGGFEQLKDCWFRGRHHATMKRFYKVVGII